MLHLALESAYFEEGLLKGGIRAILLAGRPARHGESGLLRSVAICAYMMGR